MGAAAVGAPPSSTQLKELLDNVHVDKAGYFQNAGFTITPITALERSSLTGPHAIVLHRTDSWNLPGSLESFKTSGKGTHFIIDKDGTIHQTASLLKYTNHVGRIRSRCYEAGTCSAEETKKIKSWGWNPDKLHDHEKVKSYPTRFPKNEDSVGIEVVAKYHKDKKVWDAATPGQLKSVAIVVKLLKTTYSLGESDIYEHDKIAYKTAGEGAGLYTGGV
jgi:N-acetyl-anhydromuramyl-L-alanine amidase AmpD